MKMQENIIDIDKGKFPLMKILNRHCKIDMMLTLFFGPEEIMIQEYNTEEVKILAITTIPISSFESYNCKKSITINVPINIKDVGGKCEKIEVVGEDSWRVAAKFKFNSEVTYEVLSHMMSEKRNIKIVRSGVSFINYFPVRKILEEQQRQIDVIVKNKIASFKTENKIFKFIVGEEEGKLYCKFMKDNLKPLNKLLGAYFKGADFKFSNESENYLFSIETKNYRTDIELKRFTGDDGYMDYL